MNSPLRRQAFQRFLAERSSTYLRLRPEMEYLQILYQVHQEWKALEQEMKERYL